MTKERPPVFSLDDFTVKPNPERPRQPRPKPEPDPEPPAKPPAPAKVQAHRTSMYFDRKVHDKLRLIAFERRISVAALVHEALDLWLVREGFPTTAQLKAGK